MITHVVLMKFTESEHRHEAKWRLEELPEQIPDIESLTVGLSIPGTTGTWDLCLITVHDSIDALKGYIAHPAHDELVTTWLRPRLESRAVVDYES